VNVAVRPRGAPVIVTMTPDTRGAMADAVRVKVDVTAGLAGVTGLGVNTDAVTPVGRPLKLRVTSWPPPHAATSNAATVDGVLVVP